MDDTKNGMDLLTRCMGSTIGGVSALLAIGASPPASHREGLTRVACGTLVTYCCTGIVLDLVGLPITVDRVLTCALLLGAGSWWLFAAFVSVMQRSNTYLARWFVKKVTGMEIPPDAGQPPPQPPKAGGGGV